MGHRPCPGHLRRPARHRPAMDGSPCSTRLVRPTRHRARHRGDPPDRCCHAADVRGRRRHQLPHPRRHLARVRVRVAPTRAGTPGGGAIRLAGVALPRPRPWGVHAPNPRRRGRAGDRRAGASPRGGHVRRVPRRSALRGPGRGPGRLAGRPGRPAHHHPRGRHRAGPIRGPLIARPSTLWRGASRGETSIYSSPPPCSTSLGRG